MKRIFRPISCLLGLLAVTGCAMTPTAPLTSGTPASSYSTASLGFTEAPPIVRANLNDSKTATSKNAKKKSSKTAKQSKSACSGGVCHAVHKTKATQSYLPTIDGNVVRVTNVDKILPPAAPKVKGTVISQPRQLKHCPPGRPCIEPCPCPCPVECPKCCPQQSVYAYGEHLYLNARGVDVPFGQSFDGVAALRVPRSRVGLADPEYSSGFRVGAGAQLSECSWIQGTYTYFDSDTTDDLLAPAGTSINPLLIFPGTFNAAVTPLDAINVNYSIGFQFADVELKNMVVCNDSFRLSYLVGGRYAQLDQDLRSTFTVLTTTTVDTDIDFWGGGIRGGLEGEYFVGGGFYSYGKSFLNLIAGHFDAKYTQRNNLTGLQAEAEIDVDRVVPILEFEVGVGWQNKTGQVRVHGGYHIGTWFNVLTTPSLVQGVRTTNYTTNGDNFRDTITFDGLVGRVEFRY